MDDLEFVKRCVRSDKQAWQEFQEKYCRLIYSFIHAAFRLKGVTPAQSQIQDIYQEIFASLLKDNFRKLKTYKAKNGASLASWLRQVVMNKCIDYLRTLKPQVFSLEEPVAEGLTLAEIIPYRSLSATEEAVKREELDNLTDCIERLDSEDRFFLELTLQRSLALEELKDFYKVSRGAIDMRKQRIVQRLRDCFKQKGYEVGAS